MASSKLAPSHKRSTPQSHKANSDNHPTTRDSMANIRQDLELEIRCREHILSLRLSAQDNLPDVEIFKGVDWMKEEAPWPPDAQFLIHRYMHDKNLYQATSIYANLFQPNFLKLVSLIKPHTGVPSTRNSEQKVQERCMDFINTSARTWELDGLLVTRNNTRKKSEVFQKLWDCAIQAARVSYEAAQTMERAFPRNNSRYPASSVDVDSMTGNPKAGQQSSLRKRSAESMQQQQEPRILASAKRLCTEQSNLLEDLEGDSIEVDCGVISVASDEEDLAEESASHTSTASVVATSGGIHRGGNFLETYTNRVDSAVLTARETLSTIEPAESGRQSFQGRVQPSQEKMHRTSTANLCRYPMPTSSSNHDSQLNKISSASPSHSSISSGPLLATDKQPSYIYDVQSDAANQFGEERLSPDDSDIGFESRYTSSASSEEPEFLGFSKSLADQPRVPTKDQNSSKAIENYQLAFNTRSNQSSNINEVQGQSPLPSRRSFQDRNLEPARMAASVPPISPSTSRMNDLPPVSSSTPLNNQSLLSDNNQICFMPYNPPSPHPAREPPCSSQKDVYPPITKEQQMSAGPPLPCPQSRPRLCSIPEPAQPPLSSIPQSQPCPTYPPLALYRNQGPSFPPFPPLPPASAQNLGYLSMPPASPKHQGSAPPPFQPSPNQLELHASSRPSSYEVPPLGFPPAQSACSQGPSLPPTKSSAQWHGQPYPDSSTEVQDIQRSIQHSHHVPSLGQEQFSTASQDSSQFAGQIHAQLPLTIQNESASVPPDLSTSTSGITSPNLTASPDNQQALETNALLLKKYNEMVTLNVLVDTQPSLNLHKTLSFPGTSRPGRWIEVFASSLWLPTLQDFFQSVSVALGTDPPTKLFIDFWNVHSQFERRMILPRGDSNSFDAMKIVAWEYFKETMNLDPAATNIKIYIIPSYSTVSGSGNENMSAHQSQQLHDFNTASNVPSDQQSFVALPNRNDSSIEPGSTIDHDASKPRGPPRIGPPPESQSSLSRVPASETTNSHECSSNLVVESIPDLNNRNKLEGSILESNNNLVQADVTSIQNSQRQPRQLVSQLHNAEGTKFDNINQNAAKIVIRIQIDGLGRLSRSYDKSVLNTSITNERFFTWFEQQTGRACSQKLKFNFKDAVSTKPSSIEKGNEDHFGLMVRDIKRKFKRAKVYTPDMNEFCIVVTDPMWDSGEEEDDDDEDE